MYQMFLLFYNVKIGHIVTLVVSKVNKFTIHD